MRFTRPPRRSLPAVVLVTCFWHCSQALSQHPTPAEEIKKLKEEMKELKGRVKDLEKGKTKEDEKKVTEKKSLFSGGVLTLGGMQLKLGGKAELLFIDTESERDATVGDTDTPDPRFLVQRLRLEPEIRFTKEISVHGQIDFRPDEGRTILKELTARYDLKPESAWWFGTDLRFGLDDRFIRPTRRTKNYPLIGNAFWRDESVALTWMLRFGDERGKPEPSAAPGRGGKEADAVARDAEGEPVETDAAESEGERTPLGGKPYEWKDPFDFASNPGEIRTYASIGNGNTLDTNQVGFDKANFDDIVQDSRDLDSNVTIREVGLGLGYGRSFSWLGDVSVLGFLYNDELNDQSLSFLHDTLTVRDPVTGAPIAGYGDSDSTSSWRYGVGGDYFLSMAPFFAKGAVRGGDGVRLQAQWIQAQDGELRRDGFYVQGSYKWSFPTSWRLGGKYFRSLEPILRYSDLNVNLSPDPRLPGTWDRRQVLVGGILEVHKLIQLKIEYAFNDERTGGGGATAGPSNVDNNELIVELLLHF